MSNKLGSGFHVELLLKTNKESFDQGRKAIDGVGIGVTNLLGTVRTAVPLIAAGLTAINGQTTATAAASASLGFSVKQYEAWGAAARQFKVNADGLYSGMERLESIRVRIKQGEEGAANSLAKPLGWLGITDLKEFIDQNPAERVAQVFTAAQRKIAEGAMDLKEASQTVGDILGGEFGKLFMNERTLGGSFFSAINKYYTDSWRDGDSAQKALGFNREMQDTIYLMDQMSKYAGTEFGAAFTPLLKELNEFFREHKDDIKSTIADLADSIGVLVTAIGPFAGGALKVAIESIKELTGALATLFKQDWKGAGDRMKAFFSVWGINSETMNKIEEVRGGGKSGADIRNRLLAANVTIDKMGVDFIEEYLTEYDSNEQFRAHLSWAESAPSIKKAREKLKKYKDEQKIYQNQIREREYLEQMKKTQEKAQENDGKLSAALLSSEEIDEGLPALLNSGIFAAFLPNAGNQTVNAGGNIIQQTININGDADPFTVKQAAYDGASTGLIQAQAAGLDKLQLMSGIA